MNKDTLNNNMTVLKTRVGNKRKYNNNNTFHRRSNIVKKYSENK